MAIKESLSTTHNYSELRKSILKAFELDKKGFNRKSKTVLGRYNSG